MRGQVGVGAVAGGHRLALRAYAAHGIYQTMVKPDTSEQHGSRGHSPVVDDPIRFVACRR
jgi:hypothetical protein